jgi:hypothetical protein
MTVKLVGELDGSPLMEPKESEPVKLPPFIGGPADTLTVMQWPEFHAFADRLGIPLNLRTSSLRIKLDIGSVVIVEHEFHASDTKKRD